MNSKIKTAENVAEQLNQSYENSDTKKKVIQHKKAGLGQSLKEMGKQSTAWPGY
jgi:hypothetical protein